MKVSAHMRCIVLTPESELENELLNKWSTMRPYLGGGTYHCFGYDQTRFQFRASSVYEMNIGFSEESPYFADNDQKKDEAIREMINALCELMPKFTALGDATTCVSIGRFLNILDEKMNGVYPKGKSPFEKP